MEFFDINTMIGRWPFNDLMFKTADGLCNEMDRLHISKAIVYHSMVALHTAGYSGNDYLAKEIAEYPQLIGAMACSPLVNVEYGGANALCDYMTKNRIGTFRLHPIEHGFTLHDWNMDELFELADEKRVPVLIDLRLSGEDYSEYYGNIHTLAKKYVNAPIVLLTVGYRHMRILMKLMEKCPNISVDTSTFITYRGIEEIVKYFGSKRLLFGSRMPFIEGGVGIGRIIYADISDADKENIAYNNAARLLAENKLIGAEVVK